VKFRSFSWNEFVSQNPINALLGRFKRELIGVGVFSMVVNVLTLTPTIYMLQVFDHFLKSQSGVTLLAVSGIALFCFLLMAFAEWVRSRVLVRAGVRFDEMLNSEVFKAGFASALRNKGINLSEPFSDLTNLRQFMTGIGIFALFDAPWIPIYMLVAYLLHPLLGLLTLVFVIMLAVLLRWSQGYQRGIDAALLESNLRTSNFIQAKLRNVEVIEALGMLGSLRSRWQALHRKQLALNAIAHDRMERAQGMIKFVQYSQQSLSLAVGAILVLKGELSPGAMVAANMLVARACQPMQMFVSSWRASMAAKLSYGRLVTLLEQNPERVGITPENDPTGRIQIYDLIARAEGREAPILDGITAQFNPREIVAIVGPSGGGKSTLARCILGLWEDFSGDVLLDGHPVREWDRHILGGHIGYVPQDVELFDGTVADNISRFGVRDAHKIVEAAKAAGVHEMILRFPEGYDTQMGIAGSILSGGQRQRIALARALYGEPSLIVLDEPNANLDDAGEAALMEAVSVLRSKGKALVFISHRPSVLAVADRIMLIDRGRVAAFGEREAVLAFMRQQAPA